MKNLADFKKRLVPGQRVHGIRFSSIQFHGILEDTDLGIRPISKVQSHSFSLVGVDKKGELTESWCTIPKASDCSFPDENTIIIYWGNKQKVLQYKFID